MSQTAEQRAARRELNDARIARGLRPVRRGRKIASPLPRRTVDRAGYAAYMRSEAWQDVRRRYWASKLPKDCYVCGSDEGPKDLHHRTYKNLGNEYLRDLVPLCRRCHDEVHALHERKPRMSLWGATNALRGKRHPIYNSKAKAARRKLTREASRPQRLARRAARRARERAKATGADKMDIKLSAVPGNDSEEG